MSENVVEIRKSTLGKDNDRTMGSMVILGLIYMNAGRGLEAVDMLQQVLEWSKMHYGEYYSETLNHQSHLASAYDAIGQPEAGMALLITAIELGEKTGAPDHDAQRWKRHLGYGRKRDAQTKANKGSTSKQLDPQRRKGLVKWLKKGH